MSLLLPQVGHCDLFPLGRDVGHLIRPTSPAICKDDVSDRVVFHTQLSLKLTGICPMDFPVVDNFDTLSMGDLLVDLVGILPSSSSLLFWH